MVVMFICLFSDTSSPYSFTKEVERLKFDLNSAWRNTEINRKSGYVLFTGINETQFYRKKVNSNFTEKMQPQFYR